MKGKILNLIDDCLQWFSPGRCRKDFKSKSEYQLGVKAGRLKEKQRIIRILEADLDKLGIKDLKSAVNYLKWLP